MGLSDDIRNRKRRNETDYWHDIDPGKEPPERLNIIIEIPQGSQNKYELDKKTGIFKLDRVLFSAVHYPGDYGIIPGTLAKDGDPLDALVLITYPTYPGVLIESRPIGILRMIDGDKEDDKILAAPLKDTRFSAIKDIDDIEGAILNEIAHFFSIYKQLEGREVEIRGWEGVESAHGIIMESIEAYDSTYGKNSK